MKTYAEFINESQNFLRSIGKNDHVDNVKTFGELKNGDWFYTVDDGGYYYASIVYGQDVFFDRFCNWSLDTFDDKRPFGDGHGVENKTTFYSKTKMAKYVFYSNINEFMELAEIQNYDDIIVYADNSSSTNNTMKFGDFKKKYLNEDV